MEIMIDCDETCYGVVSLRGLLRILAATRHTMTRPWHVFRQLLISVYKLLLLIRTNDDPIDSRGS